MANHSSPIARYASRLRSHQHFWLILVVFLTFRLLMPFVFRNGSYFVEQAPDMGDFLRWGTLADSRLYPYVNYSWDYPPLLVWSVIGLNRLSELLPAWSDQRLWLSITMQLTMMLADAGSLILVYAIALRTGRKTKAIRAAALFAGSFIAAYAASGWYEPILLFLLLLSLYLALRDRVIGSGLIAALGLMIKIVPVVVVPASFRYIQSMRGRVKYVVATAVAALALLLPFLLTGTDHLVAFLRVASNRPTWLSIWAVFDGNYQYGATLPIIDRFSPANVGAAVPSQLPWPIIHLAFAGLFLFLFTRRLDWRKPINLVAFTGITLNLMLLWSKGFSGQFTVFVVPFIVLLMPNLRGAVYAALLSIVWVAEWPLAFNMLDGQNWFIVWLIILRTAVLVALCFEYSAVLFSWRNSRTGRYATRFASAVLLAGWLSLIPVSVMALHAYTQTRIDADTAKPALDLIRSQADQSPVIAFGDSKLFRRLYPAARLIGDPTLLPVFKHAPEADRLSWLNQLTAQGPFWFIADAGDPETVSDNQKADAWMSEHACKVETQWAGSTKVSHVVGNGSTSIPINATATFADEIELSGANLSNQQLHSGGTLCVELNWKAIKVPAGDYTVFVHLVNSQGQVVAQTDLPPRGGFAPTSQWKVGSTLADKHGVILPANLPSGEYTLQAGLYRSDNQAPVRVTQGEPSMPDSIGINLSTVNVTQ